MQSEGEEKSILESCVWRRKRRWKIECRLFPRVETFPPRIYVMWFETWCQCFDFSFFPRIFFFEERKFLGKLWKFKFATQYRGKVIGCHWQPRFVLLDFILIRRHSSRIYWFHQIALDFITNLALLSIAFCFVLDILASLLRQTRQKMQEPRHEIHFCLKTHFSGRKIFHDGKISGGHCMGTHVQEVTICGRPLRDDEWMQW